MQILKNGNTGYLVKVLLQCLNIELTGIFDSKTEQSVKEFLSQHSLAPNGIVNYSTWAKLTPCLARKTLI